MTPPPQKIQSLNIKIEDDGWNSVDINKTTKSEQNVGSQKKEKKKNQPSKSKKEEPNIPERMKNFFSQLLEDTLDEEERQNNP